MSLFYLPYGVAPWELVLYHNVIWSNAFDSMWCRYLQYIPQKRFQNGALRNCAPFFFFSVFLTPAVIKQRSFLKVALFYTSSSIMGIFHLSDRKCRYMSRNSLANKPVCGCSVKRTQFVITCHAFSTASCQLGAYTSMFSFYPVFNVWN